MDDTEEYLKIVVVINHTTTKIIPNIKEIPKIIPKYVATPFPPLNLSQTGKIWPMKHIKADKKTKSLKYL